MPCNARIELYFHIKKKLFIPDNHIIYIILFLWQKDIIVGIQFKCLGGIYMTIKDFSDKKCVGQLIRGLRMGKVNNYLYRVNVIR